MKFFVRYIIRFPNHQDSRSIEVTFSTWFKGNRAPEKGDEFIVPVVRGELYWAMASDWNFKSEVCHIKNGHPPTVFLSDTNDSLKRPDLIETTAIVRAEMNPRSAHTEAQTEAKALIAALKQDPVRNRGLDTMEFS